MDKQQEHYEDCVKFFHDLNDTVPPLSHLAKLQNQRSVRGKAGFSAAAANA